MRTSTSKGLVLSAAFVSLFCAGEAMAFSSTPCKSEWRHNSSGSPAALTIGSGATAVRGRAIDYHPDADFAAMVFSEDVIHRGRWLSLAKRDLSGTKCGELRIKANSKGHFNAHDVAVSKNGDIAIVGMLSGKLNLFGRIVESRGAGDGFLIALNSDGKLKGYATLRSKVENQAFSSVAYTETGNHIVVGGYTGATDRNAVSFRWKNETAARDLGKRTESEAVIAVFNTNAELVEYENPVPMTRSGEGSFDETMGRFVHVATRGGKVVLTYTKARQGGGRIELATYDIDAAGKLTPKAQTQSTSNGGARHLVRDVAMGANGYIYLAGNFTKEIVVGARARKAKDALDAFTLAFDNNLVPVWLATAEGPGDQRHMALAVNDGGYVFSGGEAATGTTDFWVTRVGKTRQYGSVSYTSNGSQTILSSVSSSSPTAAATVRLVRTGANDSTKWDRVLGMAAGDGKTFVFGTIGWNWSSSGSKRRAFLEVY